MFKTFKQSIWLLFFWKNFFFIVANNLPVTSKLASHRNSIYSFYNGAYNFNEANTTCKTKNGFLAQIKTAQVQSFIEQQIEDYKSYAEPCYKDGFIIGLHQVGENNNQWIWSDKEPVNYTHWYKTEPNYINQKCAIVGRKSKLKNYEFINENVDDLFGYWIDIECNTFNKFICQNLFGSGFISPIQLTIKSKLESSNCTVYGNSRHNITWSRNGSFVTTDTNDRIYQIYDRQTYYSTTTIVFINPFAYDDGTYTCLLIEESVQGNQTQLKSLQLKVEMTSFDDEMTICSGNELSFLKITKITCSMRGRPIPTLSWKVNNKDVKNDANIFTIFYQTKQLNASTLFSLVNPISFQKDTAISCFSDKKVNNSKSVAINSELHSFDGFSYKLNLCSVCEDMAKLCKSINGVFLNTSDIAQCHLIAAEMQDISPRSNICYGNEMLIEIKDFTFSPPNFTLIVEGSSFPKQIYLTEFSKIKLINLKQRTNYSVLLKYQPTYWKSSIELQKFFQTKGTIPDNIDIIEANLTNGRCEVRYNLPKNIDENQIKWIKLNILTINGGMISNHTEYQQLVSKEETNLLTFNTSCSKCIYKFTISAVSCSGESGNDTKPFKCYRIETSADTASNNLKVIITAFCGIIFIILLITCLIFCKYQNSSQDQTKETSCFKEVSLERF